MMEEDRPLAGRVRHIQNIYQSQGQAHGRLHYRTFRLKIKEVNKMEIRTDFNKRLREIQDDILIMGSMVEKPSQLQSRY